jgi:ATP-dependent Lon protease
LKKKIEIAKRHLLQMQRENHGLQNGQITIDKKAFEFIMKNIQECGSKGARQALLSFSEKSQKKIAFEEKSIVPYFKNVTEYLWKHQSSAGKDIRGMILLEYSRD